MKYLALILGVFLLVLAALIFKFILPGMENVRRAMSIFVLVVIPLDVVGVIALFAGICINIKNNPKCFMPAGMLFLAAAIVIHRFVLSGIKETWSMFSWVIFLIISLGAIGAIALFTGLYFYFHKKSKF